MTTPPGAQTGVWNFRSRATDCSWHPGSQSPPLSLSTDQAEMSEAQGLCGRTPYLCDSCWPVC